MALDLTSSMEWENCDALHMQEEDRSDVNILNDTTCSKEESRTNEPLMLMSSSLSVTPSIASSVKSSKSKKKMSLSSFLNKSSDKKSSSVATTPVRTSPPKCSQRSVKTLDFKFTNKIDSLSQTSIKSKHCSKSIDKTSTIDEKSTVSSKKSIVSTPSHTRLKSCDNIEWESISSKAVSIVHTSKSIKNYKDVACNAIISAIALKSDNSNAISISSLPNELSEVAAIASNIVLAEIKTSDKESRKVAAYVAKAIMRAGTAFARPADASQDVKDEGTSIASQTTRKSSKSIYSAKTQQSSKSTVSHTSRISSTSKVSAKNETTFAETSISSPDESLKDNLNATENEQSGINSIAQFLNLNNTSNDKVSSNNTVQSLFEKFNRWQNTADDTKTL